MVTKTLTSNALTGTQIWLVTWPTLANGDTGSAWEIFNASDNCFSVDGTFGTGGSVTLKGSNDSSDVATGHWYALHDPQGNAITLTAAGMKQVLETPRYIAPFCTAGDGTTALVPLIRARRGSR